MLKKLETGDNLLKEYANKARKWFNDNDVEVPTGTADWQGKSVRRGEIPPDMSIGALRRNKINVLDLLREITGNKSFKAYNRAPIDSSNIVELGFKLISSAMVNKHKKLTVECLLCGFNEVLDYGTLQRMKKSGNKYCRVCRNAGGKTKPLDRYDTVEGFIPIKLIEKSIFYKCLTCGNTICRGAGYCTTAEYLVCEYCNPRKNIGSKVITKDGAFDSYFEYKCYEKLLEYLKPEDIIKQKSYNELFNTGTKHVADFFIPSLDLVLEVTTASNNLGAKYLDTVKWKLSVSNKVKFAYSIKEVEDIVRPLVKAKGL